MNNDRLKEFKKPISSEDARIKRSENYIKLKKEKKDEHLAKKRSVKY